jgi:hypothetical protein
MKTGITATIAICVQPKQNRKPYLGTSNIADKFTIVTTYPHASTDQISHLYHAPTNHKKN